jgi:histidinol-phosphate aminotransferase
LIVVPDFKQLKNLLFVQIIEAITPNVKLLFLCSPGNPTSKSIPISDIRTIASHPKIVDKVIVVVDEAYIDFASTPTTTNTNGYKDENVSAVQLINEFTNIVVLQTLSKAFGLAAIRCGFCIGPKDIIQLMNNVKAPYNVNSLTSQLAYEALDRTVTKSSIQNHIIEILQQRDVVVAALQKMDFVTFIYPSDANFVLFRLQTHAYEVYKYMADTENIVTRYRGTELHCTNCIRVTIGTPNENQAFIDALQKAYATITNK